jgi:hypothetical protein
MTDVDRKILEEMECRGGSFCKALAQAAFLADGTNFEKLKQCWPDYFAKYEEFAKLREWCKKEYAPIFINELRIWRPIATAPKDGTYVIIGGPSQHADTPIQSEICRWEVMGLDHQEGWWSYSNSNWFAREGKLDATCWMPLPSNGKEFA